MTLLEVITNASSTPVQRLSSYPIVLNTNPIFPALKPENEDDSNPTINKLAGWELSKNDVELIKSEHLFFNTLKNNLKNDKKKISKSRFLSKFIRHLLELGEKKNGISTRVEEEEGEEYACKLVYELGSLMGRDVRGLILEGCVEFEIWSVLECLIVNGLIEHSKTSYLISSLIEKRNSALLVSCVKNLLDIQAYDLLCILKYFLVMPVGGYASLVCVRLDWENQANIAMEKFKIGGKDQSLAKDAMLLIMLGHDGFTSSELCLNYFLSSKNVDGIILAACVRKLSVEELKALVQYLGKWIKKYDKFPQIGPCPMAASSFGLEVCKWIPTLDDVAKCLGLVVDEHFSSLVLGSETSEELRSLEGIVSSLANEARVCGNIACLLERLRTEDQLMQ